MSEELKPFSLEGIWTFDVDKFIERFDGFVEYFEKEVSLINSVSLERDKEKVILNVDIPSTEFTLELGLDENYESNPSRQIYYFGLSFSPITITYLEINEEQFGVLVFLCNKLFMLTALKNKKEGGEK